LRALSRAPLALSSASCWAARAAVDSEERLLQQMLELDNAYEAGKVKKSEYEQRRAKLKARLRIVMGEKVTS